MSAFSDAFQVFNNVSDAVDDQMKDSINSLKNTTSISARAKQSFFTYPVLFSPGIGEYTVAFKITKYLELQYALFTMLTAGLAPKIGKDEQVGEYLKNFSSEDMNILTQIDTKVKNEQVLSIEDQQFLVEFYNNNKSYFNEYIRSEEAKGPKFPSNPEDIKRIKELEEQNKKLQESNTDLKDTKEDNDRNMNSHKNKAELNSKESDALQKAGPTIIDLSFRQEGIRDPIPVKIAIKAYPHFIKLSELCSLFESAIEDKRIITRFIKMTSGEISFFKDWLFNMDRAKRDEALYKKFGMHPWYQQFVQKKNMNALKRLGIIIGSVFKPIKTAIQGTSNALPTATIMCTTDEISISSKMKFSYMMKDDRTLKSIMSRLMLLGIGVYDVQQEVVHFYFSGFKKPIIVQVAQMSNGSGGSKTEQQLAELMNTLLKRGAF
jgi:hypothetical protein